MTTILLSHKACFDHDTGAMHPERPARLEAVLSALEGESFAALERREAPKASREQLMGMHPEGYVDDVLAAIPATGQAGLDADTVVSAGSGEAALRAAGAVCAGVDAVVAIGADTPDPEGGLIRRDARSGEPDGVLEESASDPLQAGSSPSFLDALRITRAGSDLYLRVGVTTVQSGYTFERYMRGLTTLSRLGVVVPRLVLWPGDELTQRMLYQV